MADNSSEQVPGQQTDESSVHDQNKRRGEEGGNDESGLGRDASSD